ncbi:YdeI/OmpD-associated family protein [Actinocorallia longicatena]|uniref:DUF1905 domain-containing protein n=1 Tax=Actinocorallia longicatena TaxID=111803 RepID=A0ABP6Q8K3_9ACTN
MTALKFHAVLETHGRTATGIEVPDEIVEALGSGRRPPVTVTLGAHTYRSTLGVMGGRTLLPVSAEHRRLAGVAAGDSLEVVLELDTAPRDLPVPADLAAALDAAPGAAEAFARLSPSARKRHIVAVESARQAETRARRVAQAVDALLA